MHVGKERSNNHGDAVTPHMLSCAQTCGRERLNELLLMQNEGSGVSGERGVSLGRQPCSHCV